MSTVKEYRTDDELSGMILSALAEKDVAVQVRKDHAYGWQPSRRNRQSTPPSILSS
jgi:hypothetical protein